MKSSSDGSRPRPSCLPRKLPRCCSGLCWLLARSRCARWTAGEASPRSLPIRSLTSPHEAVISSRGRLCQTQFQHTSRRHRNVVIQILGKQNALSTDFTLDEARHLTPPARIIQNYNSTSVFTQPPPIAEVRPKVLNDGS